MSPFTRPNRPILLRGATHRNVLEAFKLPYTPRGDRDKASEGQAEEEDRGGRGEKDAWEELGKSGKKTLERTRKRR